MVEIKALELCRLGGETHENGMLDRRSGRHAVGEEWWRIYAELLRERIVVL